MSCSQALALAAAEERGVQEWLRRPTVASAAKERAAAAVASSWEDVAARTAEARALEAMVERHQAAAEARPSRATAALASLKAPRRQPPGVEELREIAERTASVGYVQYEAVFPTADTFEALAQMRGWAPAPRAATSTLRAPPPRPAALRGPRRAVPLLLDA